MRKKTIFTAIIFLITSSLFAQQIPIGSCGILYFYDATGARTKRTYFCNNGNNTYPAGRPAVNATTTTTAFQDVEALYPNPTTGIFYLEFSNTVKNNIVDIVDANGKKVHQQKASGKKVICDLSLVPAGIYFVRLQTSTGKLITKKVIKQ